MDLLSAYGSDPEKAVEGVWIPLIDLEGSSGEIKVARLWNPRFKEAFRKATEKVTKKAGREELTPDEQDSVMLTTLANSILVGWKDIKVEGKDLKYSPAKARQLLADPGLVDFRDKVVMEANAANNYRLETLISSSEK